jgi:hypothetical protein
MLTTLVKEDVTPRCEPATTEAGKRIRSLTRIGRGLRRSQVGIALPEIAAATTKASRMRTLDQMVLVIAEIIAAHCAGTRAREEFVQACVRAQWAEAQAMVEGMLAGPWYLVGYQERRLREFLELLRAAQDEPAQPSGRVQCDQTEFA